MRQEHIKSETRCDRKKCILSLVAKIQEISIVAKIQEIKNCSIPLKTYNLKMKKLEKDIESLKDKSVETYKISEDLNEQFKEDFKDDYIIKNY